VKRCEGKTFCNIKEQTAGGGRAPVADPSTKDWTALDWTGRKCAVKGQVKGESSKLRAAKAPQQWP